MLKVVKNVVGIEILKVLSSVMNLLMKLDVLGRLILVMVKIMKVSV